MLWRSAHDTHPGNRRPTNEDSVLSAGESQLWAVADGMGGHSLGDYASATITEALGRTSLAGSLSERVDQIEDLLLEVNEHLRHHGRTRAEGMTIGSTVVVFLARGSVGVALWAGDSRLYRLRDGSIEQITRDHNPIADLLESGGVSEEEALNTETHIVTRAVGGQSDLHLDVAVFDLRPDDTVLLCSDGLYREISLDEIRETLDGEVEVAARDLMQSCLRGPARDNVSLVIAKAEEPH